MEAPRDPTGSCPTSDKKAQTQRPAIRASLKWEQTHGQPFFNERCAQQTGTTLQSDKRCRAPSRLRQRHELQSPASKGSLHSILVPLLLNRRKRAGLFLTLSEFGSVSSLSQWPHASQDKTKGPAFQLVYGAGLVAVREVVFRATELQISMWVRTSEWF
jgi:hypothetical protein